MRLNYKILKYNELHGVSYTSDCKSALAGDINLSIWKK